MGEAGIRWAKAQRIIVEHTSGAIVLAAIEHATSERVGFWAEPVIQGYGIDFWIAGKIVASAKRCMDAKTWSVHVEGVGWRLKPNDLHRLIAYRGIHTVTYVRGPEKAIELAMKTLRQRLESRRARLILPSV